MSHGAQAPVITVLMPVHNGAAFVEEAIDSILLQSFKNFELLIIDDGSTDETPAILERYTRSDPRIRIERHDAQGLVPTLNRGIKLARGEWIARMDADDIALPGRLEKQLEQLQCVGADFCGGAVECFGDWKTIWRYPQSHNACEAQLLFDVPFAHPAVMGRRAAFADLGYDPKFVHCEDYDIWQRAWAKGYRFSNIPYVILRYRVHQKQVSMKKQKDQREKAKAVRMRMWYAILPEMDDTLVKLAADAITHGSQRISPLYKSFERLLYRYEDEAKEVIVSNLFRIFCKNAGTDKNAALHWYRLLIKNRTISELKLIFNIMLLSLISLMSITADSKIYQSMRKIHACVSLRKKYNRG